VAGVPLAAILNNVDEHGPYFGASSPDRGGVEDDVFGFERFDAPGTLVLCLALTDLMH